MTTTGETFDSITCSAPAERSARMRDITLEHLASRPGLRILDLGCGTGTLAFALAAARPDVLVTGIDVSGANIRVALEQLADSPHGDRVTFQQADYLAYITEPYDVIVTDGVLHLIPGSTGTLIAKLARDLAAGGLLIVAMPYDCTYNRVFAVVRQALRRVRGPATDALILSLARALHGKDMDEARLAERVHYMYIPPARLETKSLTEEVAPASGLHLIARHPMPSTSPSQLKHRVTVFEKEGALTRDVERPGLWWWAGLAFIVLIYLHNTLPHLTAMPRVNVDEPWLMERAYQVLRTGAPSQPMLGTQATYLLQVGYGYLLAPWFGLFGVGLFQARLLGVLLGLGILLCVASIGRRTIDTTTGLAAALFLAADSNFLGGVRNARTDIPSVFFIAVALCAYLIGRERSRAAWFAVSGAAVGLAMLCHGNAFWVGLILFAWYGLDYGRRLFTARFGYAFLGGLLVSFGPYLAIVLMRWAEVKTQIGNFAGDRVPGWRPAFLIQQVSLEAQRYRDWYFGLVTNTVPNPLLWAFQAAVLVGIVVLAFRIVSSRSRTATLKGPSRDEHGPARLLVLAAGGAFIFAAFINNKVAVYMPHLLIGFSLAAGAAVSEAAVVARRFGPRAAALTAALFVAGYGTAAAAYYEKWYSSAGKSELVPYESTDATLRTLVPAGPKYLFASPQFWTTFHAEPETRFYSYAAAQPLGSPGRAVLAAVDADRPIFLIVDELQWLPELDSPISQSTSAWQQDWIGFIERHCALDGTALGTAHGTLALYRCALADKPSGRPERLVGGSVAYQPGDRVLSQTAEELAAWPRYEDPRQTAAGKPEVRRGPQGLRISGTGWPGIATTFSATPGQRYLVRAATTKNRDGDLLYLGTWQRPEVLSLGGASSAGIIAQLIKEPWFPHDRAFTATSSSVRITVYSEAPETDFEIASLDIYRLEPLKNSPAAH